MAILPKALFRFNIVHIMPRAYFRDTEKLLTFVGVINLVSIDKTILGKKDLHFLSPTQITV